MTGADRTESIRTLLTEAEQAHGVYETTILGGVYDQAWPAWYAVYAVEHGIGDLVGHSVTAEHLGDFLAGAFERFRAAEPAPAESWAAWTASRIVEEL